MFTALDTQSKFFKDRVSLFVALSPTTKLSKTKSDLIKFTTQKMQIIIEAEILFDTREIFGPSWRKDRGSV